MAKKVKKKATTKVKKKKWISIIAPKLFLEQQLGETPVVELEDLVGRTVTINMMTLTRDPKKQGQSATFVVTGMRNDRAVTEMKSFRILPSSMKRMIRRGKDRLDLSLKLKTKDSVPVQVKAIILTRTTTKSSVHTAIHHEAKALLIKALTSRSYEDFVKDTIQHKIQREIFNKIKKIYPLVLFEIRAFSAIADVNGTAKQESSQEEETAYDQQDPVQDEQDDQEPTKEKSAPKKEPQAKAKKSKVKEEETESENSEEVSER